MISLGIIAGLTAMLGWGIADFMQSIPIRKLGTFRTIFVSNLFTIVLSVIAIFLKESLNITILNIVLLTIGGFVQVMAISNFYKSIEIGELSIVSPISASFSLLTVILVVLILGQALSVLTIISILVIVTGIVLTSTDLRKLKHLHTVKGVKESLVALVCWGIFFFIIDIVARNYTFFGINFPETNYIAIYLFTGIIDGSLLSLYGLIRMRNEKKSKMNTNLFLILLFTNLIYAVVWIIVNYAITKGFVAILTPISSLYPAVVVMLAVVFYKEKLVLNQKIGILTILFGLLLISL